MSESTYTNTDRSPSLSTGAHDTGLYDPGRHDNRIVAVYETRERAVSARDMLVKAGVPSGDIELLDQSQMAETTPAGDATDQGIWGSIKSLFVPDEDAYHYAEGVRRGHAVLSVNPAGASDRHHVIEVLESTDPIDFDARLEEWRQAGYTDMGQGMSQGASGPGVSAQGTGTRAVGAADGMAAVPAPVVPAPMDTSGRAAGGGATTGSATAGSVPMADDTAERGMVPSETVAGGDRTGVATAGGATVPARVDDPDTIKLMEERLRVGKREVARGAVRVRSYVVERPVEEQVRLHDERVTLERHRVDQPVGDVGADAFRERTIEVRATGEEAVVAKEARVVEEIGIRKEASDRTETVRDTVRRTEVEVEDTTNTAGMGTPASGTSSSGSTGTNKVGTGSGTAPTGGDTTTSTTGATSSGMNAPRK